MAELDASNAVEQALAAIARDNERLRAVTSIDATASRSRAAAVDRASPSQPLRGLTFVAKELIDVAGMPTTGGSKLFDPIIPTADAPIVRDLQAAGAVVVGKSNMHELAVGGAKNPWFGQVVNPLSPCHGTGGTSSGSVAAVAAGLVDFALGTDSGGSNRSTAAATGLYGYKPTNGRFSIDGIVPVSPTMDTVGLLARNPNILRRTFASLTGAEVLDDIELAGSVLARPISFHSPVDAVIAAAVDSAVEIARANGSEIVEIEFPDPPALAAAGRTILRFEFFQHHGREILDRPDRVGADVGAFIKVAGQVTASQYEEALSLVTDHRGHWRRTMQGVDALLLPAVPGLAPRLEDEHTSVNGAWVPYGPAGAELRMWANTIGIPAVAVPVPRPGKLPASIQLAGHLNRDESLLGLASALGEKLRIANQARD